jgi:hypothetical protein
MQLSWLPVSDNGPMVADYIGVSYNDGNPFGVFAVAKAPSGSVLNEAMYTTRQPLVVRHEGPQSSSKDDRPVRGAKSDHVMTYYYDDGHHIPIPASRLVTQQ